MVSNFETVNHLDNNDFITNWISESGSKFDHCQIIKNYSGNMGNESIKSALEKNQKVKYLDCRHRHDYLNAMHLKVDGGSIYIRQVIS